MMFNNHPAAFASTYASTEPSSSDDSNMIPLINIVFLLLIFFMVAGKISSKDAAQFEAPHSLAETTEITATYHLIIAADRSLWLDGQSLGFIEALSVNHWNQIEHTISNASSVIVKADAELPAFLLDPLLKRLRDSGQSHVQLAVQTNL